MLQDRSPKILGCKGNSPCGKRRIKKFLVVPKVVHVDKELTSGRCKPPTIFHLHGLEGGDMKNLWKGCLENLLLPLGCTQIERVNVPLVPGGVRHFGENRGEGFRSVVEVVERNWVHAKPKGSGMREEPDRSVREPSQTVSSGLSNRGRPICGAAPQVVLSSKPKRSRPGVRRQPT